jgi:hypothetical protein
LISMRVIILTSAAEVILLSHTCIITASRLELKSVP